MQQASSLKDMFFPFASSMRIQLVERVILEFAFALPKLRAQNQNPARQGEISCWPCNGRPQKRSVVLLGLAPTALHLSFWFALLASLIPGMIHQHLKHWSWSLPPLSFERKVHWCLNSPPLQTQCNLVLHSKPGSSPQVLSPGLLFSRFSFSFSSFLSFILCFLCELNWVVRILSNSRPGSFLLLFFSSFFFWRLSSAASAALRTNWSCKLPVVPSCMAPSRELGSLIFLFLLSSFCVVALSLSRRSDPSRLPAALFPSPARSSGHPLPSTENIAATLLSQGPPHPAARQ